MRIFIRNLITQDLGYCCEFAFFHHYRQNRYTPLIAERLGMTIRAVQQHKAAYRRGELVCRDCLGCLKSKLL